jgi:hypothetical protein
MELKYKHADIESNIDCIIKEIKGVYDSNIYEEISVVIPNKKSANATGNPTPITTSLRKKLEDVGIKSILETCGGTTEYYEIVLFIKK